MKKPNDSIDKTYEIVSEGIKAKVKVFIEEGEYVPKYEISYPKIEKPTRAVLDSIRERIVTELSISTEDIMDTTKAKGIKERFVKSAFRKLKSELPNLKNNESETLVGILVQESLGLGVIGSLNNSFLG